jgi:hypothetical protein
MNDPIVEPSRFRHDIPYELDAIVMRALARTPADRYDTTEEMEDALEAFLARQSAKYDARSLARMLEEVFGTTRGSAKRAIAQTRSLSANISLVMKLRTDVRGDLTDDLDSMAHEETAAPEPRGLRTAVGAFAALLAAGLAAAVLYLMLSSDVPPARATQPEPAMHATIELASEPAGAAISIAGEPTGLKTPATLNGLAGGLVTIRLELPGHDPIVTQVDVAAGGTLTRTYTLKPTRSR